MGNQVQQNSFQIAGRILEILPPEYISEKLTKRSLIMEVFTGQYSNQVNFEFKNDRGTQLNDLKVGEWCIVTYELAGRKYAKEGQPVRYFNTLNGQNAIKG
ncbi:MAG: DUF3127 domain-containing protein [Prolixibacteraceae bacterium]|nr:DUF3127 domain-containing protein [Prolixibacteraceae bacterium]